MIIIKCGTKVTTKLSQIEAIVTGVTIRYKAVQYELSYFTDQEYRSIWMNENEFLVKEKNSQRIGFNK